jgi:hypothetical protein
MTAIMEERETERDLTTEGAEVRLDDRFRRIDARYRLAHLLFRRTETGKDGTALVLTIKLCAGGGRNKVASLPRP